ncbi:uncharacterized protein BXZ73DRAFT_107148 [Epithele typhae]|uniref:uncharacterized protein n=1 Tax=Epithele typhae TaxID=378194 RepID=UPI002008C893|nr:uncharacterized protein BXZ73DRAFT_107148 [Epithele typhae]KAH9912912.1 hypothetical protein BXZ73DRAFT_107148 [Epithele typhae]
MRMGDSNRLEAFLSHLTRMRRSNVPDCTHDPMTTTIYLLHRDVPPRWPSSTCVVKLFAIGEESDGAFRTLMLPDETGSVIGRQPLPTPASPRRARDGCQHLATRVLGNTFILGRTRHSPMNVCLPPNVVAFFGLSMRLQRVGHLTYWLSGFHARILSGSTARSRSRIASRGACSRTRWLVNLDIVLETTLAALRFSALPAGLLCTLLVLCRVDAISLGSLAEADLVRRVFEDRPWGPVLGTQGRHSCSPSSRFETNEQGFLLRRSMATRSSGCGSQI